MLLTNKLNKLLIIINTLWYIYLATFFKPSLYRLKAEGEITMKKDIHPAYHKCKVTCVSCGATFETGSVLDEIRVDTCSNCHPYYTGKQRFTQTDGRVDRFMKKYGMKK